MAPHLRIYYGPEEESTPISAGEMPEIVVGDSSRTAAPQARSEATKLRSDSGAAEIAVGLEELLQLIEEARRCGVALQDEVQHETVHVSRDLFRALLAYQTLLQPHASLQ